MSATATRSHNRIVQHQTSKPSSLIPPATPAARQAVMADAFFTAILTLKSLLASDDPALALRAAELILDVEKTRIRHDRDVIGLSMTTSPEPPPAEAVSSHEESAQPTNESCVNWADPFEVFVSQTQPKLQAKMDEDGHGDPGSDRSTQSGDSRAGRSRDPKLSRGHRASTSPPESSKKLIGFP